MAALQKLVSIDATLLRSAALCVALPRTHCCTNTCCISVASPCLHAARPGGWRHKRLPRAHLWLMPCNSCDGSIAVRDLAQRCLCTAITAHAAQLFLGQGITRVAADGSLPCSGRDANACNGSGISGCLVVQVRAHLQNLEKGQKQVCHVFEEWTSGLNPGPVSTPPRCLSCPDSVLKTTAWCLVILLHT